MKITLATKELSRALAKAIAVVQSKVTIPVLSNIKLDFNGVSATISASDLGQSIVATLPILSADADAGSVLLPARKLQEILGAATAEQITIDQNGEQVSIKIGKYTAKIRVTSPSAFPVIPTAPPTKYVLNLGVLKSLIDKVEVVVPSKEGRYAQTVIQLERTGTTLRAVATDGYRITVADAVEGGNGDFTLLLTKAILPVIKDMAGDVVEFSESDNHYFYTVPNLVVLSNKPSQKFPDYKPALTNSFKTNVVVPVADLQSAIARVLAFVDSENAQMTFSVDATSGELNLSSASDDGNADDQITAKMEGIPNTARLNPTYVQDFLSKSTGDVIVEFISEKKLVRLSNGTTFQSLVMPMRDPAETKKEEAAAKPAKTKAAA